MVPWSGKRSQLNAREMKTCVQLENSCTSLYSLKLEIDQVSYLWEKGSTVMYTWNGMPLRIIKEQNVGTHNVDEFQKHYAAEWKKPFFLAKEDILYDSIYIKFLKQSVMDKSRNVGCLGETRGGDSLGRDKRGLPGLMVMFSLHRGLAYTGVCVR